MSPPNPSSAVKVLLLEDSEIDAELLAAHLNKAELEHVATRVVNRREFVTALEAIRFDVILADYSLPDFDGLSALSIAKALSPDTPFIFVSGVVGEEFATSALKRGATDYVMKRSLTRLPSAVRRALAEAHERLERRRTEEALQASELNLRLAVEAAELGAWSFDPQRDVLDLDARGLQLLGASDQPHLDLKAFLARLHPSETDRVQAAFDRLATSETSEDGALADEWRIVLATGAERWLAVRGQVVLEASAGRRVGGVLRDVTEERRAQQALKRVNESLEAQVEARTRERDRIWRLSRDLFAVADFQGRLLQVNPAWSQTLGYGPEQLIGGSLVELIHPEDRAAAGKVIKDLEAGRVVERFETRVRNAGGSHLWICWTGAPGEGAFYAVGRDITDERAAAEALNRSNAELRAEIVEREKVEATLRQMQRLEAVGQLTSGVAHDFNNLLTVVLGNIGFIERRLERAGVDGEITDRIAHVRTAAERGAKLTAQMLAFSRRQKLEPKPIDLNGTVAGMRELLQSTMGGSVRLETVLKSGLWPALVDPTQIELIILNLAINARDAMEVGGGLTVETANVTLREAAARPEEPGPGDYVMLSVSDTGPGMTPEVLARAFEPFFTTKAVGKGSGLGLAQVYGFAKQSGGGVRIDTRPGEGTSVKVYLPRAAEAPAAETGPETPVVAAPGAARRTILLVDDDSAVREVTAAILSELNYELLTAGSGGAALDLLRSDQPVDLLLADYAMPGMNGAETARAAREIRPGLPVLFISGYADLQALREVGEERVVQKPFRDDELARKVAQAIGLGQAPGNVVQLRR